MSVGPAPSFPEVGEFLGFLGPFFSEIVRLCGVGLEVVEFPGLAGADEFEIALANGVGAVEVPVEFLVGIAFSAFENRQEGFAARGQGLVAVDFPWVLGAGDVPEGGGDVDDVADLISHARLDDARPVSDERGADAAFVVGGLELAVGRVAGVGPADGDRAVAFYGAGGNIRRGVGLFGAGAVVGEEHYERVVPLAQFFDLGEEAAEVLVDAVDHGGVHGHLEVLGVLLFLGQFIPSLRGPLGEFVVGADDAHLIHPLEALLADLVPADLVFAAVLGDVFGPGVERVVRRGVG